MDIERLRTNPTIALFIERARSSKSGFDLTPENAEAVIAICHRLDGLPLSIDMLDGLASLMDKSLIDQSEPPNGDIRFRSKH